MEKKKEFQNIWNPHDSFIMCVMYLYNYLNLI